MVARCLRVLMLGLLWSGTAGAQSAGAQAEAMFRQGRQLLAAGKTTEACSAFAESQRLEPAVTTLVNLAACREKNGQLATAWGLFLDVERQTRDSSKATDHQLHDVAVDHAKKLEPRVSKLTINVPQTNVVDGLEVSRGTDRVEAVMWNRALPIDGGTYTIVAKAPGSSTWTTQVTIGNEGDTKSIDVPDLRSLPRDLTPAKPAPTTPTPESPPPPVAHTETSRTPAIITGAASVALLGAALGFELWGESKYNSAKATTDQSQRDSLESAANTRRYAAEGFAVAGLVGAGVTTWLLLRGHDEEPAREARIEVAPTGTGFVVRGVF